MENLDSFFNDHGFYINSKIIREYIVKIVKIGNLMASL